MIDIKISVLAPQAISMFLSLAAILTPFYVASGSSMAADRTAVPTADFLDSIGVVTTFPDRGQPLGPTIQMLRYGGFRWVRAGVEGLTDTGPTTVRTFLELYRTTGVRLSWGLGSGGTALEKLLSTAKVLARSNALLAFEGNNEPNNWGIKYKGLEGGGKGNSWQAIANLQSDLYRAVKSDPDLRAYPVWSVSEPGAENDNYGLQFLKIPPNSDTLAADNTDYADFANVHNYIYHPNSPSPEDNKVWNAADPSYRSRVDGLYGNFGQTWGRKFRGYSDDQLTTLPRVTTETGVKIGGEITEDIQGVNLVNLYLAQYVRGYSYTSVYLLRDRTDEGSDQAFGFFGPDYKPRKAAVYLHNLTTILADKSKPDDLKKLQFSIQNQPDTVHDLLLENSNGKFQLVIWGERINGKDHIKVKFADKYSSIAVYDVTEGVDPVNTISDADTVELDISNHPIVLSFSASTRN